MGRTDVAPHGAVRLRGHAVTGTLLGGFIYALLVIAVVLILVRIITGRKQV